MLDSFDLVRGIGLVPIKEDFAYKTTRLLFGNPKRHAAPFWVLRLGLHVRITLFSYHIPVTRTMTCMCG